ncbi:hypothetical protein [Symbioplanes lichenis]|uniref:hypothetical protein n=1 Tax=Symbioplanes lichenis TaxID=1629072 RepID=UPI00273A4A6B|nr:hypothetical protein [Actinoplanes lichenis]
MGIEQHTAGGGRSVEEHSAVAGLRHARFRHRIAHLIAAVAGVFVALWFLGLSVGGEDRWHKAAEALGGALIFASVSGIGLTALRWVSGVEKAELAAWEQMLRDRDGGPAPRPEAGPSRREVRGDGPSGG